MITQNTYSNFNFLKELFMILMKNVQNYIIQEVPDILAMYMTIDKKFGYIAETICCENCIILIHMVIISQI